MTLRKLFLPMMAAVGLLAGMTACNSGDDPGNMSPTYANIVTLKNINGQSMTVDYMPGQFKDIVTLTCQAIDTTGVVTIGGRFLIAYQLPEGMEVNQSGAVTLLAYQKVVNGSPKLVDMTEYATWGNTIAQVNDMSMSNTYLNVGVQIPSSSLGQSIQLLVGKNTLTTETAEMYVYVQSPSSDMTYATVRYASFDLAAFKYQNPNVKKITVHSPNQSITTTYGLYPGVVPSDN